MDLNSFLSNLTPQNWGTLLTLALSGAGVAVALQIIKHYGKLAEAKKTVMVLLGILSFGATYADSLIQYAGQNPKAIIGAHLGWVVTLAVFIHRFAVSPSYYKLTSFLNGIYADHVAYQQEQAASAPVGNTASLPSAPQEFSLPS